MDSLREMAGNSPLVCLQIHEVAFITTEQKLDSLCHPCFSIVYMGSFQTVCVARLQNDHERSSWGHCFSNTFVLMVHGGCFADA